MSRLLARAIARLDGARFYRENVAEDDAYLDSCCFSLQQSIEFALKYLVEQTGTPYKFGHDISIQLNDLIKAGIHIPHEKEFCMAAATINSWETESMYNDSFTAAISMVDDFIAYTDDLLTFAKGFITEAKDSVQSADSF